MVSCDDCSEQVVDIDFKGSAGSHPLSIAAEKLASDLISSVGYARALSLPF
jgi:hypothetical protein